MSQVTVNQSQPEAGRERCSPVAACSFPEICLYEPAEDHRSSIGTEAVPVLERGTSMPGDPQHGWLLEFPPVRVAEHASNGGTVRVDPLADGVPHSRPRARRNDVDLAVLSLRVGV
jgi:hypothetical protein